MSDTSPSSGPSDDGRWVHGEPGVPLDPDLQGKSIRTAESMTAVWRMIDPVTDEQSAAPVLIFTFYHHDSTTSRCVFDMQGVGMLMAGITDYMQAVFGSPEVTVGDLTDEGLTKLIDDLMGPSGKDES